MPQLFSVFPDFLLTAIQPEHQAPAVFMYSLYFSALKISDNCLCQLFMPLPPEAPPCVLPVPLHHSR